MANEVTNLIYENGDKKSDVRKIVEYKRGQIYICDLDEGFTKDEKEHLFSQTGLIGKARPCMIYSNSEYNCSTRNTYMIIPIKTNHTDLPSSQYIKESYDLLVPIWMGGIEKFLVINQARPINARRVSSYIGTVTNEELLDKVDKMMIRMECDDKYINDIEKIFSRYGSMDNIVKFLASDKANNCWINYKKTMTKENMK